MVTIDNTAIIKRILAILENDTTLKGIIRDFQFGEDNHEIHDGSFPYILVTTPNRPIISRDTFGIGDGSSDVQTTIQYQINGFVLGNDSEDSETQKYDILKLVIDILRANPRLKNPDTNDDPKCIRSVILSVDYSPNSRGKENQGFVVTLQCQIGSASTATLTGGLVLDLLSFSAPEGFNFDENLTDEQSRCIDASSDRGTWLLEYENTPTNETAVLALLGTVGNMTLTKNGVSRIIKVSYITITPSPRFDEIERSILHVEKTL